MRGGTWLSTSRSSSGESRLRSSTSSGSGSRAETRARGRREAPASMVHSKSRGGGDLDQSPGSSPVALSCPNSIFLFVVSAQVSFVKEKS